MPKNNRKSDRRIRRTRRQLQHALRQLIRLMPYEDISITRIVDTADISRATFYLHYDTKDDLLVHCFATLQDDLSEANDNETLTLEAITRYVFNHIQSNRLLYKQLQQTTAIASVLYDQINTIIPYIHESLANESTRQNIPLGFHAYHIAGTLVTTGLWWLDNDSAYTKDQLIAMTLQTMTNSLSHSSDT